MTTELLQWVTVILLALIWLAPRRPAAQASELADICRLLKEIQEELKMGNKYLAAIDDKAGFIFIDVQKILAYKDSKSNV